MADFKILIRSIFRQKLNSGIIVVSLTIGIACINMIMMFIIRELGTDGFHNDVERIYALKCDDPFAKGAKIYQVRSGAAEYMKLNFSQVEDFCRTSNASAQKIIANNESWTEKPGIISASPNFFDFFSYHLLSNNPKNVLEAPNSLVISEEIAKKYFGTLDAEGQIVRLIYRDREEQFVVSGVFRKPADNSQIIFNMVVPIKEKDSQCYIRLAAGTDPQDMEKIFRENIEKIPVIHGGTPGPYYLIPFRKAYFDTVRGWSIEASRDKKDLWIALVIGLMIMGIASVNYLGLVQNNLIAKTKEFAIRKINGGSKWEIILDFMSWILTIVIFSFILSWFLMLWMMPFFNKLTGTNISAAFLIQPGQILILCSIALFLLLITLLFSLYRIRTGVNLKELNNTVSYRGKNLQSRVFTVFQLTVSIILIISSFMIIRQINYITNKPIGINKQVIEIKIPGQYSGKTTIFGEELKKSILIDKVSVTMASPLLEHYVVLQSYKVNGIEKQYLSAGFIGDENFISTLGIELIEGDDFSGNPSADKNKCLINQSLVNMFPDQNLIGRGLPGMEEIIVSGIVKDFHYSSLKSLIEPAFISFDNKGGHLLVKAADGKIAKASDLIKEIWRSLIPDYPLNTETVGERYEWYHNDNRNYVRLIGSCCIISLFLAMIGLFAISYQTTRYRTREIGLRKVNGARVSEVMLLLNKDYIKWIAFAFVIALPIGWYVMYKWLQGFSYKTDLSWWIFALAGLMALGVALLTVSWQSWRAAMRNPVEALRYE